MPQNLANSPAFPSPALDGATDERALNRDGMTLRAYFAAKAMQGMLAATQEGQRWFYERGWNQKGNQQALARLAVEAADALIAELER